MQDDMNVEEVEMRVRLLTIAILALFGAGSVTGAGLGDLMKSADEMMKGGKGTADSAPLGGSLSDDQIGNGLKQALEIGAERAVAVLGQSGGFLDDPSVRIPLPGMLESAGKGMRAVGQGALVDEFEQTVNRAAEEAVPQTLNIVRRTVSGMSLEDVRGILNGGDDAATQFLRERAGGDLQQAILPIISKATDNTGATAAYKRLEDQASGSVGGLLDTSSLDLDDYVAEETLDGMFLKLAEEEKKIRENPVARSTDLLKSVFGSS
jgi:hypothetical protein